MGRNASLAERILIDLVREGQWEIDAEGRVWRTCIRVGRKGGGSHLVPVKRRRAEHQTPLGYLQVRAVIGGRRLHCGAHRLVWQHHHGDIPESAEINHENGLKDDNRPSNLTCGTAGDNVTHAHRGGLRDQHGEKNPARKLTDNQVARIRLAYDQGGHTMKALAKRFRVSEQTISKIVKGQSRQKQGGPVGAHDRRHSVSGRDPKTGRWTKP